MLADFENNVTIRNLRASFFNYKKDAKEEAKRDRNLFLNDSAHFMFTPSSRSSRSMGSRFSADISCITKK